MLFLVVFTSGFLCAGKPLFSDPTFCSQVEERLRTEQITKRVSMVNFLKDSGKTPKGDQRIMLVEFESGLRGVFKPGQYRYAEVAAYKASSVLRIGLVPPTVLRTIDGVEGSIQLFVDSDLDTSNKNLRRKAYRWVSKKEKSDMNVFYYVFGQWDSQSDNQIITSDFHLALIDNAALYHSQYTRYGDFSFVCKGINSTVPSRMRDIFPLIRHVRLFHL